jgi:hypothetical protein
MTPEQQRIAIAEACGWKRNEYPHAIAKDMWWHKDLSDEKYTQTDDLPDYLNDLNAMHEAEKILNARQQVCYFEHLAGSIMNDAYEGVGYWMQAELSSEQLTWRATAAQRAKAFLKTIGKWIIATPNPIPDPAPQSSG